MIGGPFRRSLTLRLLAILAATGAASVLVLIALSREGLSGQWQRSIQPHLRQYVAYVQQDLGNPPSAARADALARRVPIDIALYRNGVFVHATNGREPPLDRLEFRRVDRVRSRAGGQRLPISAAGVAIANDRRAPVLRVELDDWTVYYRLDSRRKPQRHLDELLIALLALGAVLAISWLAIRRQLNPIGSIKSAVARMADGDLEARARLRGSDDLARLGDTIDSMAARLQAMLDAKRELLLAVSHELKSPLARMRVALEMMPQTLHRERMVQEVQDMSTLIDDLLESERLQDRHVTLLLRPLDLGSVLQRCAGELADAHDVELTTDLTADALPMHGDEARLMLLFRNLLRNACLHGRSSDGIARIGLHVRAGSAGDGRQALVTITDQGPGIEPALLERVREPFSRPDASRSRRTGGAGLGLTLADRVAVAHGGELGLRNRPGVGLQIDIRLPLQAPEQGQSAP